MKSTAALLALALLAAPTSAQTPWKTGQPLPHVHLPDVADGTEVDLASFRGKKLVLIEFASW
jgi:hypothetical protein